jgi:hypothetical protein
MSPPGIYDYAVAAMKQISEPTVNLGIAASGRDVPRMLRSMK